MKPVLLKLVFLIICSLNTSLGAVSNSKSFRKCLEYYKVNGSINDLIPIDTLNGLGFVIGGGWNADPEQLPFMAALGYGDENQIKYFCGGTLISERFVLTAAHCVISKMWGRVKFVRLGDLNLKSQSDDHGVQMYRVDRYYIHPNFKYPFKYHDIALIKLDRSVTFWNVVAPACLYFSRNSILDPYLYAAGWGATGYGENRSDHLQVGPLVQYNISECRITFPKQLTLPMSINNETQICAGAGDALVDTCEGDSGGPLGHSYVLNDKLIHFVIGVTSFGQQCFMGKIPAVYSKVSYYTNWIESITWPEKRRVISDKIFFPSD